MPPEPALPTVERRAIVRDGLAVGVATGAYGVSFGAISVSAGLDVWQTCALSLLVFTGASQFALVGVIASGGAPLSGALTALLLGTRNTLYGLRLAPLLGWRGWRRVGAAQILIDESTAMSVNRESTAAARVGFLATGLAVFALWNLATLAGAVAGRSLGDPRTYGLDAAVGAAFLALLWPRLTDTRNRIVAVLAAALALGVVPVAPAGVPVLAAAAVAILAGVLTHAIDPTEIPGRDDLPGGGHRHPVDPGEAADRDGPPGGGHRHPFDPGEAADRDGPPGGGHRHPVDRGETADRDGPPGGGHRHPIDPGEAADPHGPPGGGRR